MDGKEQLQVNKCTYRVSVRVTDGNLMQEQFREHFPSPSPQTGSLCSDALGQLNEEDSEGDEGRRE